VAISVLGILLAILATVTSLVSRTVRHANREANSLTTSRAANDLSQKISLATLNTYYAYDNFRTPAQPPKRYVRLSDLQFLIQANVRNPGCGQEIYFASPLSFSTAQPIGGLQNLLNACGYFVQYNNDDPFRPSPVETPKWRYRLMQGFERTENLKVFKIDPTRWAGSSPGGGLPWLETICNDPGSVRANVTPVADNVIALILRPQDPSGTVLSSDYTYDSAPASVMPTSQPLTENQLPPVIQLTVITIDEASATRIDTRTATEPSEIKNALSGRFTKTAEYAQDLEEVGKALTNAGVAYRVFNTSIPMREAKWSGN
jgi:uncharacterized protein (TIGR02599 family)